MSDTQLIIVVMGVVAMGVFAVIAYLMQTNKSLAQSILEVANPLLESAFKRADQALATSMGTTLQPVNTMLQVAEGFIDSPEDKLVRMLHSPAVVAALLDILNRGEELTNGVPLPDPSTGEPSSDWQVQPPVNPTQEGADKPGLGGTVP